MSDKRVKKKLQKSPPTIEMNPVKEIYQPKQVGFRKAKHKEYRVKDKE